MATAYAAAARSLIRSSTARTAASRTSTAASKPRAAQSPFRVPSQNLLSSPRILRSPVELSCCVESLLPYHTATASALLTSLLSATPRCYGWNLEVSNGHKFLWKLIGISVATAEGNCLSCDHGHEIYDFSAANINIQRVEQSEIGQIPMMTSKL